MKVEFHKCENCKVVTEDMYNEIGWIHIDSNGLSIFGGRKENGVSNTLFFDKDLELKKNEKDFCSLKCLISYLFSKFNNLSIETFKELLDAQTNLDVVDYLKSIEGIKEIH